MIACSHCVVSPQSWLSYLFTCHTTRYVSVSVGNAANISKSMSTGTVSSSDQFADRVSNSNRSDGIRVGIITFDRHIQYYQITELQSQGNIYDFNAMFR